MPQFDDITEKRIKIAARKAAISWRYQVPKSRRKTFEEYEKDYEETFRNYSPESLAYTLDHDAPLGESLDLPPIPPERTFTPFDDATEKRILEAATKCESDDYDFVNDQDNLEPNIEARVYHLHLISPVARERFLDKWAPRVRER